MAKTALELTPEALRAYNPARRFERARREQRLELDARRARAWAVAREAARLLKQQFGAGRVAAFGSLTRPDHFSHWSDIDLAVVDLPPQHFYRAVAAVTGLSAEFEIDLVDPMNCRPSLRQRIEREGQEVEPAAELPAETKEA
ncbi:MAG: nucleotidyltransferase domain-containing protein [Chloroflexi bacterium]|nr:nucleotidyltransferase domain-containing protein [Chloroflexota bacterium]